MKGISTSRVFVAALAVIAVGGAGYLLYSRLRRNPTLLRSDNDSSPIIINNNMPASTSIAKASTSTNRNDAFPLKRGSRGARVTQLQQAIANKIGVSVMNANGGIDGQFGQGTANALKIAGYGEVIDETTFKMIVAASALSVSSIGEASTQARILYNAARAKNLEAVISALRGMHSTTDYSAVNSYYKLIDIVGKTIVTDLLDYAFQGNEEARNTLKTEFLRIGLKVNDSGVWSLQGFALYRDVVTMRPTFVIDTQDNRIPVQANAVLGDELRVENGMTWVRSIDNSIFRVPTQDIKYTR
ncbi:hypothetical protein [Dawidia soli]|uniref:Uncharacterized protein n=1 Tax=Dawidia soli TaxID=2782352 RepID=A0AAP2GJ04_9BACT|nr:hypothetical protein [Dawidia soli]MBT1688881.1 hypothetical protein [Dawidia soli]